MNVKGYFVCLLLIAIVYVVSPPLFVIGLGLLLLYGIIRVCADIYWAGKDNGRW